MSAIVSNKPRRTASPQNEAAKQIQLLTISEAAICLGIGKRTIQELTANRKLAFIKFGRNVRFAPADLVAFAEKNRVQATGWKGGNR